MEVVDEAMVVEDFGSSFSVAPEAAGNSQDSLSKEDFKTTSFIQEQARED